MFDRDFICKMMHKKVSMSREMLAFFEGIIFKMKSLSNMILFDFGLKIKFDRDFILKMMRKK